jgi:hypothetical protein
VAAKQGRQHAVAAAEEEEFTLKIKREKELESIAFCSMFHFTAVFQLI